MTEWILLTDKEPENRQRVLVVVCEEKGRRWQTIADYFRHKETLAEDYLHEDCRVDFAEYDEEEDCYWTPRGFFESPYMVEMNYFLRGVTHWMPLPEMPDV